MTLTIKTPPGYRRLRAGIRPRKSDLEIVFNQRAYEKSLSDFPTLEFFKWEPLGWESGVDDWRVEPGDVYIRKVGKRK